MGNLYIFAIGGTGSRVLESLTMLLASGVKIEADSVIPIIIDPDKSNGNLAKCTLTLENYQKMYDYSDKESGFFSAKIENICSLHPFIFELESVDDKQFKEYIGMDDLDSKNKALIHSLFTTENLNLQMDEGFKGNPNIGSIVLNQFLSSQTFLEFANRFTSNDRIFIISSIFGGTGAAGFPLLLENLRQAKKNKVGNGAVIANSVIGAVTYLPYFSLATPQGDEETIYTEKEKRAIESSSFVSKSSAALSYYTRTVNKKINTLYYIADPYSFGCSIQEYGEGSGSQKNKAHFAELLGAMAIIDFMNNAHLETKMQGEEYLPLNGSGYDYGLKSEHDGVITFNIMSERGKEMIAKSLTQFSLFSLFIDKVFNTSLSQPWATDGGEQSHITESFDSAPVHIYLKEYFGKYKTWLTELKENRVSFCPLSMEASESNLFKVLVTDNDNPRTTFREGNLMKETNFIYFNRILNEVSRDFKKEIAEKRFLPLFYKATEKLAKGKYRF